MVELVVSYRVSIRYACKLVALNRATYYDKPHHDDQTVLRRANEAWAIDFVSDQLFNSTWFRTLTVVDVFTRECLAKIIRVDNGTEFVSKELDLWAYHGGVKLSFTLVSFS